MGHRPNRVSNPSTYSKWFNLLAFFNNNCVPQGKYVQANTMPLIADLFAYNLIKYQEGNQEF